MTLLDIRDLEVSVDHQPILKGLTLSIGVGEVHALMGPNGSGKTTLSSVLTGRSGYTVTGGSVLYKGRDLLALPPEERAQAGLFLGCQYPVEIPGVTSMLFLHSALNAQRQARGESPMDRIAFVKAARAKAKELGMSDSMLKRPLNVGFSGGEKKRHEILQMAILDPDLALLDEIDSGLDIDGLNTVARALHHLRSPHKAMLLITHYQRLLEQIVPDHVHILLEGRIVQSGDHTLAQHLEDHGYGPLFKETLV